VAVRRIGRTWQFVVQEPADLARVLEIDEAHWVATSAPRNAFRCPPEFLEFLDSNGDGRIVTSEVKEAVSWLLQRLSDFSAVCEGKTEIPLGSLRSDDPEGTELLEAARSAGYAGSGKISLQEVEAFLNGLASQALNGDGVLVPEAAEREDLREFLSAAVAATGGSVDASGRRGLTSDQIESFRNACREQLAWREEGRKRASEVFPLGEGTRQAVDLLRELKPQIERYFELCRRARFLGTEEVEELWRKEASTQAGVLDLKKAPLASVRKETVLPLEGGEVNPVFQEKLKMFEDQIAAPLLGGRLRELSEEKWRTLLERLAPASAYFESERGREVGNLPEEKLEVFAGEDLKNQALGLLDADRQVARIREGAVKLKKLLFFHGNLVRFINNFASFPDLYDPKERALFERGSAVLDGRWFKLAVPVEDRKAHVERTRSSNLMVLYLEISGAAESERFTVAVPVTSGTKGNLRTGKRGVFFDINGRQYDAVVVEVIENPVSMLEALAAPFVGAWRFVVGKIESWSERSEKTLQEKLDKALAGVSAPGALRSAPAGIVAGLSVSVAALGSALAFVIKQLSSLTLGTLFWGLAATACTLCAAVLLPVGLVAFLKLRGQDLSSLLEGSGWAINARMALTRRQRRHFTRRPFGFFSKG